MILTNSSFYYGIEITEDNCKLDFDEGAGELTATLDVGTYTPEEIAAHVQEMLNETGVETYTVTFNRSTLKMTIAVGASVEMLMNSGTNALLSAWATLGYSTDFDVTSTSFVATNNLCSVFRPQFKLQGYVDPEHNIEQLHATVNESITGTQELITYGEMGMMRCNVVYITNIQQPSDGPIENNASGVDAALNFLGWITKKNKIEFLPDRNDVASSGFMNLVLDSSGVSKDGTKFMLRELYDRGLTGYYETGSMTFRKVD